MNNSWDLKYDPRRTGEHVVELLSSAKEVVIVAPFVTLSGIEPVLKCLSTESKVLLFTRWRANEVAAGVSDIAVFERLKGIGDIYLHSMLHAKAYICPGRGALIGSSNVTATGLGWGVNHGVELLVEVEEDHPAIVDLLRFLKLTSPRATSKIVDIISRQAEKCSLDRTAEAGSSGDQVAVWVPSYSYPRALWHVYQGDRDEKVTELAKPDLEALEPPSGMDEEEFNAYVGSVLLQGFSGLLVERLINLSTYKAISELSRLADSVGFKIEDPEKSWAIFASWVGYFLPDLYSIGPGGKKLLG